MHYDFSATSYYITTIMKDLISSCTWVNISHKYYITDYHHCSCSILTFYGLILYANDRNKNHFLSLVF